MTGQHDQSRLVPRASAAEALTQIRALCDEAEVPSHDWHGPAYVRVREVRAVLDAVSVDATPSHEPGSWVEGIRTRACEQGIHDRCDGTATLSGGRGQYACACGCHPRPVDAAPAQGIDRDALRAALRGIIEWLGYEHADAAPDFLERAVDRWTDRILALVRPVEGVTLTPEEASRMSEDVTPNAADRALAARLEASA